MPYALSWYTPEQVLCLKLEGHLTIQELVAINQDIVDVLNINETKKNILIDATDLQTGYQTADHLRDTQHYMNHSRLDSAFVVADNKLNRLITLMAFCRSRARFMQLNTMEMAEGALRGRGLLTT